MERGETVTRKSFGRVTSYIFMKEPIGASEKILKYVNCTYDKNDYVFNICLSYK